jgi:thiosulfate/3-mercaptopyruvate sulfurtransferase
MKLLWSGLLMAITIALAAEIAIVEPKDLAAQLAGKGNKAAILYVGPSVLYRSKHIPGAVFAGPGNSKEGLDLLRAAAKDLPKNRDVVIYCGCCPWNHCPNVQPAFDVLKQMGFTRVRVMYAPTGFKADWIDKGYPVE